MVEEKKKSYSYLIRRGKFKFRKNLIETSYIHGVRDQDGKQVIRPLTDEEKAWLNQFYKEEICVVLNDYEEVKPKMAELKELRKKQATQNKTIKTLRAKHEKNSDIIKANKKLLETIKLEIEEKKKEIEDLKRKAGSFNPTFESNSKLYKNNYSRREDLYENADSLVSFNSDYYDKILADALDNIDHEYLIIKELDAKKKP